MAIATRSKKGSSGDSDIVTVPVLAKELGIGINAVYDGLKTGSIPSIRMHRKYIIPRAAIREWLRTAGGKVV